MTRRLIPVAFACCLAVVLPGQAVAAPTVPMKCSVKGQMLPSASIVDRGTITYSCVSSYLGSSSANCPGTIFGTATSGTCSIGMLTVVRCEFKGSFNRTTSTTAGSWKGDLKLACGLTGTPPPRVDCTGSGGGTVSSTGAITGTITGYCERPGTE